MQPIAEPSVASDSWIQRILRWCARWRLALGLVAVVTVFSLSSLPNTHPPRFHGLDKAQHLLEYFALGLVFLNVASRGFSRLRPGALVGAWGVLLLVALLDETYQRWIPGRSFDWYDMLASATGGLTAILGVALLRLIVLQPSRERT